MPQGWRLARSPPQSLGEAVRADRRLTRSSSRPTVTIAVCSRCPVVSHTVPAREPRTAVRAGRRDAIDVRTAVVVVGRHVGRRSGAVRSSSRRRPATTSDDATLPISTLAVAVVATWCCLPRRPVVGVGPGGQRELRRRLRARVPPDRHRRRADRAADPTRARAARVRAAAGVVARHVHRRPARGDGTRPRRPGRRGDGRRCSCSSSCVGAPIVEELVYRGLLQRSFVGARSARCRRCWRGAAWFAIIHFRPVEYPGLFVAGLVFGMCAITTGRLGMSIVTHVAFNATGLLTSWQSLTLLTTG